MSDENKIKLGLELGDASQKAEKLATSLMGVRAAAADVADTYEVLAINGEGYELVEEKVEHAIDDVTAALNRQAAAATKIDASMSGVTTATKDAEKATKEAGRAALNASQSFQDFVQGGIGGVLNNLPRLSEDAAKHIPIVGRLAAAFGGPVGLAASVTTAFVAFYAFKPAAESLFAVLTSGGEKIPETADAVDKLQSRLKDGKKILEDMAEAWKGTSGEVEAYNKQLAANVELEKKANVERERKKALEEEAAGGKVPAGAAEAAQKAVDAAGGFDATAQTARNALNAADPRQAKLRAQLADLAKKAAQRYATDPYNLSGEGFYQADIANAQRALDARTGATETEANDLVGRARKGDQAAIERLADLVPGAGFNAATTEGLASAKESQEAAKRAAKDQEEREKERKKADEARDKEREKDAAAEQKAAMIATNNAYAAREKNAKEAEKADAEDARLNAKLARDRDRKADGRLPRVDPSVAERQAIGAEFAQRSAAEGVQWTPEQVEQASVFIQQQMGQGVDGMAAMQQAFMTLVQHSQAMAARINQQQTYMQQIRQQQATVPSLLEHGWW